jgi:transcriptional regulator with XRE-family HTH domain
VRDEEQAFYERLGTLIRIRRKKRDLTQEKLAGDLGLTRTTMVNIEKGRQRLSVHQVVVLADILGCTTQELIPSLDRAHQLSDELRGKAPDDAALSFVTEISAASKGQT